MKYLNDYKNIENYGNYSLIKNNPIIEHGLNSDKYHTGPSSPQKRSCGGNTIIGGSSVINIGSSNELFSLTTLLEPMIDAASSSPTGGIGGGPLGFSYRQIK
jgi:hypothetical protein